MAEWSFATGDAATVKQYSRTTFKQAIAKTIAFRLAQMSSSLTSQENIVQLFDETSKGPGDQITYTLFAKLSQAGVAGDDEIAGNEESLNVYTQALTINQLRFATKIRGAMSQQRIPQSMRDICRVRLADHWQERLDFWLINQATGNTNQADTKYTGMQAVVAPDAAHAVFSSLDHTAEADLDSDDTMTMATLLDALYRAHTGVMPIKPIMLKGMQINGVALLHSSQIRDLKKSYAAGSWGDIEKAALSGGQISGNPIFTGAIGMHEGIVIHESANMPFGNNAGTGTDAAGVNPGRNLLVDNNVARGVFMGAQALSMGFGRAQGTSMEKVKWVETLFDANNQLQVVAGKVAGCVKNRFNGADFATITISSWVV